MPERPGGTVLTRTGEDEPMKKLANDLIESLRIPQFVEWLNDRRTVQRLGNSHIVHALGWPTRKLEALIRRIFQ